MKATAVHSIISSTEQTLLSTRPLIDGRTEADWLNQLAGIAALLNFYDDENKLKGNWQPFLLKDPVLLLAFISKTDYAKFHTAYVNVCLQLQADLKDKSFSNPVITEGFNHLFDLFTDLFLCIRQWVYYMQLAASEYALKTFVVHQVKETFSKYLWAIISLQQDLFLLYGGEGMEPVDQDQLSLFGEYDEKIWKTNKDKSPYWNVLHINDDIPADFDIKDYTPADLFKFLKKTGDELFAFFQNIIHNAAQGLKELGTQKSKYPDTLLLRAFVDLLKIQQQQLNGIATRYFRFYYRDILKQKQLPAVPDHVFICAELAKKNSSFDLQAGTLFDAGLDLKNKPVSFVSLENTSLNAATISSVSTLARLTGVDKRSKLYLQNISNTDVVSTDENGQVRSWETFGITKELPAAIVNQAISFASPLLLLREGERLITLTLNFAAAALDEFQQGTSYYLSTAKSWLQVFPIFSLEQATVQDQLVINFILDPSQPPVEPFLKNGKGLDSDGLNTAWPMLKIEFDSFADLSTAPLITSLKIDVSVSGVRTFQLYNDYGALDTTKPYQPLGPSPLVSNSFIIGNNEIFSKPVELLLMELDWDILPDHFSDYYNAYNQLFLYKLQEPEKKQADAKKISLLGRFTAWLSNLFKRSEQEQVNTTAKTTGTSALVAQVFNNCCFTVNFGLLQQQQWNIIEVNKLDDFCTPVNTGDHSVSLFSVISPWAKTSSTSYFTYEQKNQSVTTFIPDPGIQQTPLKFTGDSSSGFIRMSLTGPALGFGSTLYAAVVSNIALQNGWKLLKSGTNEPVFTNAANLPFVPKLKGFVAYYAASNEYNFDPALDDYPIQCFLYTPLGNYNIYDSTTSGKVAGLPLFKTFPYFGNLYLGFENLIPGNAINLYFELATRSAASIPANKILFEYMGPKGWNELPVLADSTYQFNCSGIISVHVPADIINTSASMPGNNYWFHIAVNEDPQLTKNNGPLQTFSNAPASYAQTVFLKTNAIRLKRLETDCPPEGLQPFLAAGSIKKSKTVIPQLISITQPFPSFGGKAQESESMMNLRVSSRLKTKDRAVTKEDYCRLIRHEFPAVCYSRIVLDTDSKTIHVFVLKGCDSITDPSAFIPFVNGCLITSIQQFLEKRAPAFFTIQVSNFQLRCLQVTAEVVIEIGYQPDGMKKTINDALNLYLSPWILGTGKQISLEDAVSETGLAAFIGSITGVSAVKAISFITWEYETAGTTKFQADESIIVSCMDHKIQCDSENE